MTEINQNNDGKTHINVYSKGKTLLGRQLSNFAYTPFVYENIHFASVEAFWYFHITRDERLTSLYGFRAKKEGSKRKPLNPAPDNSLLKKVYISKLLHNISIAQMLIESTLPFEHYYVYGDKIVTTSTSWTAKIWELIRADLQNGDISGKE